jgi:hypothetical protein
MIDQKAFTFPFEDEDWASKFVIGSLFYLVSPFLLGLPMILPQGYALRVWRDAVAGRSLRLPTWDRWEDMGLQGLATYVILFVYTLPVWFVVALGVAVGVGGGLGLASAVSWFEAEGAAAAWTVVASLLLVAGIALIVLVGVVLLLLIGFLFPMAVGRYVETGRFGAAFELRAVWRAVLANLGGLAVVWLIFLVIGLVLSGVVSLGSTILCWIPFASYLLASPAAFYLSLVQACLMGQVYRQAQRRLSGMPAMPVETPSEEKEPAVPEPVEEAVEAPTVVPLEDLGLSTRVVRALHSAGVTTVDQVMERLAEGDDALLSIRGVGVKAVEEIKAQLTIHGFLDP